MNFVTITDNNQWRYSLINLYALYQLKLKFNYYIFTTTEYAKECIINTLESHSILYNYGKIYVDVIPNFTQIFNINVTETNHNWISIATLDRLVLPLYINLEKFVWLDTDTLIVNSDIVNLYNFATSDKGIAAVATETLLHQHILNFSSSPNLLSLAEKNTSTFNAGVCVFDLQKFNISQYNQFVADIFDRSNGEYVNDELILNLYDQNYAVVSAKYNCATYNKFIPYSQSIIHFSGADWKPWNKHKYEKGMYYKYYKQWEYYFALLYSQASDQL